MRFYLDSAQPDDIRSAARSLLVAGVTTNPALLSKARVASVGALLDSVVATRRRDWKIWVQLASGTTEKLLAQAHGLNEALVERTGGLLAGPTLVFKILPDHEGVAAATILIREGAEVCFTAVANTVQALALTALPEISEMDADGPVTEGPPASRNPHMPHALACYIGRNDDAGRDGVKTVLRINDLMVANDRRTRVLAASIRERDALDGLLRRLARRQRNVVDVTLAFPLLKDLLADPVTRTASHEFDTLEEIPL